MEIELLPNELPEYEELMQNAEHGDAQSQFELSWMYYYGYGVKENYSKALKWLRKAADQGYMYAQFELGWLHYYGEYVKLDHSKAFDWFSKAANQGHAQAQYFIGLMYAVGLGVRSDNEEASFWFLVSYVNGYKGALREKYHIDEELSDEQLLSVHMRFKQWLKEHKKKA